ncbi:unnamed protein product, partial [Cyprideis torosa]
RVPARPPPSFDPLLPSTSAGPSASESDADAHLSGLTGSSTSVEIPDKPVPGITCLAQRGALIKSMLNFLKKAFQDQSFA